MYTGRRLLKGRLRQKKENLMRTMFTATFGLAVFAMILTPSASAGCGELPRQQAANRPSPFVQVSDNDPGGAAVVGFWKITFVSRNNAGIPDGTVLDAGYAQWHSDGTEIMNSSRPPATQSFCLGVWKKVGPSSFKLNHFALSFDLNGNPVGGANIREEVTVEHGGDKYTGTFSIDVFDIHGVHVGHIAGDVTGERITAD
jgi:hypothetical protein